MQFLSLDNEKTPPIFNKRGNIGVLLIHGYTSSERSLEKISDLFAKKNITTLGVRLAGHGTEPDHMLETTYLDWIESAKQGLNRLQKEVDKIYLFGNSLGGNIALYLASQYPDIIAGTISINAPIYLRKELFIKLALPIVKNFKKHIKKDNFIVKYSKFNKYQPNISYSVVPLKSLYELFKMIDLSKQIMPIINKPALIIHSLFDEVVSLKSARYIYDNINVPKDVKELYIFKEKCHALIHSYRDIEIVNKTLKFIYK